LRTSSLLLASLVAASYCTVAACGSDSSNCAETKTCIDPGEGGSSGDGGGDAISDSPSDVPPPDGCDPSSELSAPNAEKCVVDSYGVFVDSVAGNDSNAGTRTSPVKTISSALSKLQGKPRVYVCEGTYPEHVTVALAVSIYGGLGCGSWAYNGNKPKVVPAEPGFALKIDKVAGAASITDVEFTAAAGDQTTKSSVAAFVNSSANVTFKRVVLNASTAAQGDNAPTAGGGALSTSTPGPGTLNGNAGTATNGGPQQVCTCANAGISKGGMGGDLASAGAAGEPAQTTPSPPIATGAGSTAAECNAGQNGHLGSDAPNSDPAGKITTLGSVSDQGWEPAHGNDGAPGGAGQGGGGGGGFGGGGGSGACGGCGGEGGKGGGGGGGSIALVSNGSTISLVACALNASDGATGGTGAAGGSGITGGLRGNASGTGGCLGGNGGRGGDGGAGGGGAGGVSIGVAFKGTAPKLDDATTTAIKLGASKNGGNGGTPGTNDGPVGVAAATKEF
jgi:hypothetical protein